MKRNVMNHMATLLLASASAGMWSGALADDTSADPIEAVQAFCAGTTGSCGNAKNLPPRWNSPTLKNLRDRGVDIVPLLIDTFKREDHSYAYQYSSPALERFGFTREENWGTPMEVRRHCCRNAIQALGSSGDDRALAFLNEVVRDEGEQQGLRADALGSLNPWVEHEAVRELLVEILVDVDGWPWQNLTVFVAMDTSLIIINKRQKGPWNELIAGMRVRLQDGRRRLERGENINPVALAEYEADIERLSLLSIDPPSPTDQRGDARPQQPESVAITPTRPRGASEPASKPDPQSERDPFGMAHLWAISLVLLGLAVALAAVYRARR